MHLDAVQEQLERALACHDQCLSASATVRALRRQTVAPSRKAWVAELVRRGVLPWDEQVVTLMYLGENSGVQRAQCVCGLDEAAILQAARADLVEAGWAPAAVREIRERQVSTGNPFGLADRPQPEPGSATVLFVEAATRSLHPETTAALRRISSAMDEPLGVLEAGTAGFELFDLGLRREADEAVRRLLGRLRDLGARTVVSESPGAVLALRMRAPGGSGLEALHLSEFLAQRALRFRADAEPLAVTLHDSALLARHLEVTEAPRQVLARMPGIEVREMRHNRCRSRPAGPRLWFPDRKAARRMAELRVEEAWETGAQVIVTLGPYARRNLMGPAAERGLRVMDLAELVASRLLPG